MIKKNNEIETNQKKKKRTTKQMALLTVVFGSFISPSSQQVVLFLTDNIIECQSPRELCLTLLLGLSSQHTLFFKMPFLSIFYLQIRRETKKSYYYHFIKPVNYLGNVKIKDYNIAKKYKNIFAVVKKNQQKKNWSNNYKVLMLNKVKKNTLKKL